MGQRNSGKQRDMQSGNSERISYQKGVETLLTRDKSFYRTFIKLMSALMLQQAVVLSVNLADNVMLEPLTAEIGRAHV